MLAVAALRQSYTTGRPVGAADWIARLEAETDRPLAPRKRGPKPNASSVGQDGLFRKLSP